MSSSLIFSLVAGAGLLTLLVFVLSHLSRQRAHRRAMREREIEQELTERMINQGVDS